MVFDPNPFMQLALEQAQKAYDCGDVPVGAVIVDSQGQIIASAHNLVESQYDPTAHAEMLALRMATSSQHSPRLTDCDLYVTLEPCTMCAQAISFARIRRLYYAASDPKGGGVEHGAAVYGQPTCHHKPDIYNGIGQAQSTDLLKRFFQSRRQ